MGGTTPSSLRYNVTWSYVESLNGKEGNDTPDNPFKYSANNSDEVSATDGVGEQSKQVIFELKNQALKTPIYLSICHCGCHCH